jgi:hypothetical protein
VTGTSGTAVTESDVVGATSLYYTPAENDIIEIYNGSNWIATQFTELTLALDSNSGHTGYHQSGRNYFLGVINDSGTIRLASSVAWSSDTTTGTGAGTCEVEIYQGRLVNKVTMTVRFGSSSGNTVSVAARQFSIVGGFRASANGQTEDSFAKRFVSNAQNPAPRELLKRDATASWNYSTAAYRQMNNSAANQVEWFNCVAGRPVSVHVKMLVSSSGTASLTCGTGIDSTTVNSSNFRDALSIASGQAWPFNAQWRGNPGLGYHYAVPLEFGDAGATQTWTGSSLTGIAGECWN